MDAPLTPSDPPPRQPSSTQIKPAITEGPRYYLPQFFKKSNEEISVKFRSPEERDDALELAGEILLKLLKGGEIPETHFNFHHLQLRLTDNKVEIMVDTTWEDLSNLSRTTIEQNLIRNLIMTPNPNLFCDEFIDDVLNQVLANTKDPLHSNHLFYHEVAEHILEYMEDYPLKSVSNATEIHFCNIDFQTAKKQKIVGTVCHVMENSILFESKLIRGAAIYIVCNAQCFTQQTLIKAIKHFLENRNDYPEAFEEEAIFSFIQQNLNFFSKIMTKELGRICQANSRLEVYKTFIKPFWTALRSGDLLGRLRNPFTSQTVVSIKLSKLWRLSTSWQLDSKEKSDWFKKALLTKPIREFILEHLNDPLITWFHEYENGINCHEKNH
jgi:hypothetical protein